MKIRDWSEKYLTDKCMWPHQAKEVVKIVEEECFKNDPRRLNDEVEGYPDGFLAAMRVTLDSFALKYIEEKMPKAWFKPMFDGSL